MNAKQCAATLTTTLKTAPPGQHTLTLGQTQFTLFVSDDPMVNDERIRLIRGNLRSRECEPSRCAYYDALRLYGSEVEALRRIPATLTPDTDPAVRKRAERFVARLERGHKVFVRRKPVTRWNPVTGRGEFTVEVKYFTESAVLLEALGRRSFAGGFGNKYLTEKEIATLRERGFILKGGPQ